MNKYCQSCGMPFSKDPEGSGSNSDGSPSDLYCSYCFKDGSFTRDCATGVEMQKFVRDVLKQKGYNPILAWLFTAGIPRLGRWKKAETTQPSK